MPILNTHVIACEVAILAGHYLKSDPNMVLGKSRKQGLRP